MTTIRATTAVPSASTPDASSGQPNSASDPCPAGCGRTRAACRAEREQWMHWEQGKHEDRAAEFLETHHARRVERAMRNGIFRSIDEAELERIWGSYCSTEQEVRWNAVDWLLAEGVLELKHCNRSAADLLLGPEGPELDPRFQDWLAALRGQPLRLFEVAEVRRREGVLLRDLLADPPTETFVLIEMPESLLQPGELVGLRLVQWHGDPVLTGAVYPVAREDVEEIRRAPETERGDAIVRAWLRDVGARAEPFDESVWDA